MLPQVHVILIIFKWDETETHVWNCPALLSMPDKEHLKNCAQTQRCVKHSLAFISGLQIKFLWEDYKLQFREKKLLEMRIPFF